MLLLYQWWHDLQAKSSSDTSAEMEEFSDPPYSRFSSISSAQHHQRHQPSEEVPLGADHSHSHNQSHRSPSSSDRGVLPQPVKRRRTAPPLPLLGQCLAILWWPVRSVQHVVRIPECMCCALNNVF